MEECDLIKELSEPYMINSKTSKHDNDVNKPDTEWRTSTQYFLPSENPKIIDIDYRVASLTKSKISQHEYVQVLRYEKTQQYKHHADYFDYKLYQSNKDILDMLKEGTSIDLEVEAKAKEEAIFLLHDKYANLFTSHPFTVSPI